MIVAQWQIDAKFGYKAEALESIERWQHEVGAHIGWDPDQIRIMTGSVGANESKIVTEITLESMSELEKSWDKLGEIEAHQQWSKDLEEYIVSGSHRWEIYRLT
jgi:hypothetical protein